MHAGLDGPDGNADLNRDLRQWEAEVVVEDKDRALLDGEPSEGTLELISVVDCLVLVGPVRRLDRHESDPLRPARATPGLGVARVCQDPVEPGLKEPGVAQRPDFSPRGQQRRLDGVVSKVVVAQDPERDRHASVTGQASKRIEGLMIALLRLCHQLCVHPSLRDSVVVASDVAAIGLESSRGSLAVQSCAARTPDPAADTLLTWATMFGRLKRQGILRRLSSPSAERRGLEGSEHEDTSVTRLGRTAATVLVAIALLAVAGCGDDAPSPSAGDDSASAAPSSSGGVSTTAADLSAIACATEDPADVGELTGVWAGNEGGVYYIRQVGDCLWWFGTELKDIQPGQAGQFGFANVATGRVDGTRIEVEWADLPLGNILGGGGLSLVYDEENDQLSITEQRGDWEPFGASVFTRIEPGASPEASPSASPSP